MLSLRFPKLFLLALIFAAGGTVRGAQPGSLDASFNPALASSVHVVAVQPDGKVLAGGNGLVRLNADGSLDNTFAASVGALGQVTALAVLPDGKLLVGGSGGPVLQGYLMRLNADGTPDGSFASVAPNGAVLSVDTQPDGRIVIGGYFSLVNGSLHLNIARLGASGALDQSFQAATDSFGVVTTVKAQPDGKILVAGFFTAFNGAPRGNLARLQADGTLDPAFGANAGTDFGVQTLALQPDGRILAAGNFSTANGQGRQSIARFNADGTLDGAFSQASIPSYNARALALQPDGKILVGGGFSSVNGLPRDMLARLNADGSLDTNFDARLCCSNEEVVNAIALQIDGKVLVGGDFTLAGGAPHPYLVRLNNDPTAARNAIEFAAANYLASEGGPAAVITLRRTGSTARSASVNFATSGGTATGNADYKPVSKKVDFPAGAATREVSITLKKDSLVEGSETVGLFLSQPSSNVSLGLATATLTILDVPPHR